MLPRRRLAVRQRHGYLIITVKSCDLLSNIRKTEQILSERRADQFICLFIIDDLDALKYFQHFFPRDLRAKELVDLFRLKKYSDRILKRRFHIHHTADHFPAAKLLDQRAGTINGSLRIARLKPFLENAGSIRAKSDPFR